MHRAAGNRQPLPGRPNDRRTGAGVCDVTFRAKAETVSAEAASFQGGMAKCKNVALLESECIDPRWIYTSPFRQQFDFIFASMDEPIEIHPRNRAKFRPGSKAVRNRNSIYKAGKKLIVLHRDLEGQPNRAHDY